MGSDGSFDSDLSKVTSAIQHALFARYPKYRYPVGRGSVALFWTLTKLPEIVADRMFAAAAPWYRLLENMICDWFKIILITAIYYIYSTRTRLAAELLLHGKFGFRETRLSRGATVLQLAQDENIWTLHVCSLILIIAIYVHVYLHILWLKQGSHFIQIYNLQIFLSDLIDSINLYRKRCSIERGLAVSFFSPFIITKQGQWYLEAWSHFFLTIWLMIQSKYPYIVS